MRFKEFFKLTEDSNSQEPQSGMSGLGLTPRIRKPSDGIPFKDKLSALAGDKGPSGGPGGPGGGPMMGMGAPKMGGGGMFMRKRMKKV